MTDVSREFQGFAEAAAATSPLYAYLASEAAQDEGLCAFLAGVPDGKRTGVLFFAVVHFLVLDGADEVLAAAFRDPERAIDDPLVFDAMRTLVQERADAMRDLMLTRSVQTNEVNRCVALACGLSAIADELDDFVLLDVGTSAGLNLLYDRYGYFVGNSSRSASAWAPVQLSCEVRGGLMPPLLADLPVAVERAGVDIEPVDIVDEQATRWLRACLWPGDDRRVDRLSAALELARSEPPRTIRADASCDVERVVSDMRKVRDVVVFSSWAMSWMSSEQRAGLLASLDELGKQRPTYLLTLEYSGAVSGIELADPVQGGRPSLLGLHRFGPDVMESSLLAVVQHHCQWIEWRDATTANN
jgi:hypothetical protein